MTTEKASAPVQSWQLHVITVLLVLLIAVSVFQTWDNRPIEPAWEYKMWTGADAILPDTVNALGADGWELVFARRANATSDIAKPAFQYEMIFRRRVRVNRFVELVKP